MCTFDLRFVARLSKTGTFRRFRLRFGWVWGVFLTVGLITGVGCGGNGAAPCKAWSATPSANPFTISAGSSGTVLLTYSFSLISDFSLISATVDSHLTVTKTAPNTLQIAVAVGTPPGGYVVNAILGEIGTVRVCTLSALNLNVIVPGVVTRCETEFADADWQSSTYTQTTGIVSYGQTNLGPNAPERTHRFVISAAGYPPLLQSHVLDIYLPFTYYPSFQGPISSVSASALANRISSANFGQIDGYLILQQAGKYYVPGFNSTVSSNGTPVTKVWSSVAASTWFEIDPITIIGTFTSHPDFSVSGGPIKMGLLSVNYNTNGLAMNESFRWDDFCFTLNP